MNGGAKNGSIIVDVDAVASTSSIVFPNYNSFRRM